MIGLLITLALLLLALAICLFMLHRNNRVCNFRLGLIDQIYKAICATPSNEPTEWRYTMYHTVPYDTMLNQFWKPLKPEAFYDDLSFLEMPKVDDE